MLRNLSIAVLLPFLAACAAHDQRMATDFMPLSDGRWTYKSFADAGTPLESEAGERYRMQMLEIWLGENNRCQDGYSITSRQPIKRSTGLIGDIYDVHYEGVCT